MKTTQTSLLAISATLLTLLFASPASAFHLRTPGGCSNVTFKTPPKVVLHDDGLENFGLLNYLLLVDAMGDVHAQFDDLGGVSTHIAGFELSSEPFTFKSWYGDTANNPVIHVAFDGEGDDSIGSADTRQNNNCFIREAHVRLFRPDLDKVDDNGRTVFTGWALGEPGDYNAPYYDSGVNNGAGDRFFRISYAHELLHAFGLSHSDDSYSMLNYKERPWANRDRNHQLMLLPDDVEGMRFLYPASGDRLELAVLNTWFDAGDVLFDAAKQKMLCKPSGGSGWGGLFSSVCGVDGAAVADTAVCPGDWIYTRVAVANYSTVALDVGMVLYFSEDDQWDTIYGGDLIAPNVREFSISASGSSQQGRRYQVPTTVSYDTEYHLIVRAVGSGPLGTATDEIPLRGTISIKPQSQCP